LKTKFLLGAIVVAVLAVFGVIGLQQTKTTEAANITGITGCTGTIIAVGGTCDFTIFFFDDWSAVSGVQATAFGPTNVMGSGTLATVSNTCTQTTVAITGAGTSQMFLDADGPNNTATTDPVTACDANQTSENFSWTIRYTCTTVGQNFVAVTAPASIGGATLAALTAASVGSLSPALPRVDPAFGVPYIPIACVATLPTGNSTLTIRKVDQFGQPLAASFSIQAGPFWTEVVRVNLGANVTQNPCATDGSQGSFNFVNNIPAQTGMPAIQYGTTCASVGVITPNLLPNGLSAGQYRVVEVAGPNSWCTLVQVYNGNQSQNQSLLLPYSGAMLTQPVTVNLPDANLLDLQLTFVNSCVVAGGPSTATSQIAVVIGGSTPGLVNTSNIEIVPAPGSDDDARLDIRIRDSASIPIPNAHVTVLIDKGALGLRRDFSTFPNSGYDVIEPFPASNFASPFSGDTCDQGTNGFWTQSATSGGYSWPFPDGLTPAG